MNACRISLVFMPLRSHSECPLNAFLMNACRISLVFMPLRSHSECPLKAFFDECLQEFIGFYALQVSRLMTFKAVVFMNACRKSLVVMPLRSHFCCPERPFVMNACRISLVLTHGLTSDVLNGLFYEGTQEIIGCYALQASLLMYIDSLIAEHVASGFIVRHALSA